MSHKGEKEEVVCPVFMLTICVSVIGVTSCVFLYVCVVYAYFCTYPLGINVQPSSLFDRACGVEAVFSSLGS